MCSCAKRRIDVRRETTQRSDAETAETMNVERRMVSVELHSLVLTGATLVRPSPSNIPTIRLRYSGALPQEELWKKHVRVRICLDDGATFDCVVQSMDSESGIIQIVPREDNVNTALARASLCGRFKRQLSSVRIETTRNPHKYTRTFSVPEDLHPIN